MEKKGISQEQLKLIACGSMLLDHIGATIVYPMYLDACMVDGIDMLGAAMHQEAKLLFQVYQLLRIIGRLAFPIYCFLLVEGAHRTHDPKKYALRLLVGALLSEIPFDLAFSGQINFESSSVMVTLLLGFGMLMAMKRVRGFGKILVIVPFFWMAELLRTDYAGNGILIIAMLELVRQVPRGELWRLVGMTVLCTFGYSVRIGPVSVPIELFAVPSLIPIHFYRGRKQTGSRAVQWAFYLFYPVHLLVLWAISVALM